MRMNLERLCMILTMAVMAFGLASCDDSSYTDAPPPNSATGRMSVETATIDAVIQSIDTERRTITLLARDGTSKTFKASPRLATLEGYRVGDQVTATVVNEVAVYVSQAGEGPSVGVGQAVALTTNGISSDMAMAETMEITARVVAVDTDGRTIRLEGAAGEVHTFPVSPEVDLSAVNPGDDVIVRHTEAIVVLVEQPQ
jgi:hypothetical protein